MWSAWGNTPSSWRWSSLLTVKHLTLTNFRNYSFLELDLDEGLNLFWGQNGAGKTNILEAVHLLGLTRSPRGARDGDLVNWKADSYHVKARVIRDRSTFDLELFYSKDRGKGARINGVPQTRPSQVLGSLPVVFFSPGDLSLVNDGPRERRSFIDQQISQADPAYYRALSSYGKVLAQRNQALKSRTDSGLLVSSFNPQLIRAGSYLLKKRLQAIPLITERVSLWTEILSGGADKAEVLYQSSLGLNSDGDLPDIAASFDQTLLENRRQEVLRGHTLAGPHRDDLDLRLNGRESRVYSSQGQKRTLALALKLQQVEFLTEAFGFRPVLLLDDVLSELDSSRRSIVISSLKGKGQTLITSTDPEEIGAAKSFRVESGQVTSGAGGSS